jgi:hypothetical protein
MKDTAVVKAVAADYARHFGSDAVLRLHEEEEIAARQGDTLSAKAWRDIADAAAEILAAPQAEIADALGDHEAAETWREIAAAAKTMTGGR